MSTLYNNLSCFKRIVFYCYSFSWHHYTDEETKVPRTCNFAHGLVRAKVGTQLYLFPKPCSSALLCPSTHSLASSFHCNVHILNCSMGILHLKYFLLIYLQNSIFYLEPNPTPKSFNIQSLPQHSHQPNTPLRKTEKSLNEGLDNSA